MQKITPCYFPNLGGSGVAQTQAQSPGITLSDITKVQRFCEDESTNISGVLSTAWAILLKAYTGEDNVCFGLLQAVGNQKDHDHQPCSDVSTESVLLHLELSGQQCVADVLRTTGAEGAKGQALDRLFLGQANFDTVLNLQTAKISLSSPNDSDMHALDASLNLNQVCHPLDPSSSRPIS